MDLARLRDRVSFNDGLLVLVSAVAGLTCIPRRRESVLRFHLAGREGVDSEFELHCI